MGNGSNRLVLTGVGNWKVKQVKQVDFDSNINYININKDIGFKKHFLITYPFKNILLTKIQSYLHTISKG